MANMSYCRWRNTLKDLQDCADHLTDDLTERPEEDAARAQLLDVCAEMVVVAKDNGLIEPDGDCEAEP